MLDRFQSTRVTVSTMAGQVLVPRLIAEEVEATLVEALKNVDKHAGPDAKVWVLLDQEDSSEVILGCATMELAWIWRLPIQPGTGAVSGSRTRSWAG